MTGGEAWPTDQTWRRVTPQRQTDWTGTLQHRETTRPVAFVGGCRRDRHGEMLDPTYKGICRLCHICILRITVPEEQPAQPVPHHTRMKGLSAPPSCGLGIPGHSAPRSGSRLVLLWRRSGRSAWSCLRPAVL